jgi:hypothetical protein
MMASHPKRYTEKEIEAERKRLLKVNPGGKPPSRDAIVKSIARRRGEYPKSPPAAAPKPKSAPRRVRNPSTGPLPSAPSNSSSPKPKPPVNKPAASRTNRNVGLRGPTKAKAAAKANETPMARFTPKGSKAVGSGTTLTAPSRKKTTPARNKPVTKKASAKGNSNLKNWAAAEYKKGAAERAARKKRMAAAAAKKKTAAKRKTGAHKKAFGNFYTGD